MGESWYIRLPVEVRLVGGGQVLVGSNAWLGATACKAGRLGHEAGIVEELWVGLLAGFSQAGSSIVLDSMATALLKQAPAMAFVLLAVKAQLRC